MLIHAIDQKLQAEDLNLEDFRELVIRLLNYGLLVRDESQVEQILYDRYLRIQELVEEYLELMGVRVFHDPRFAYLRLYPPASRTPGMEDAEQQAYSGSLRSRFSQHETALLLALRLQYDQALREGKVDAAGFVNEPVESIGIALKNNLGRSLPDKLTERKRLFHRMRQLRLIRFRSEDDLENPEAWLQIHPMIVHFVSEEALDAMEAVLSPPEETEAP